MTTFISDGSYGFNFWAITLPANFPTYPPETSLSFLIAAGYPLDEVTFGDVIYGFTNDRLVIACEVLEMMTPPELQVCIDENRSKNTIRSFEITAVRTRVMPVDVEDPYIQGTTDCWPDEFRQEILEAFHDSQALSQSISGAAMYFDLGAGIDLFESITRKGN